MSLSIGDRVAALSFEPIPVQPAVEGLITMLGANGGLGHPLWACVNWEDGQFTDEWYLEGQDFVLVKKATPNA